MATVNKEMKTFNVPNGNDVVCYEIVDDKGRKAIAKDWASNSTAAFAVGEYTMKDGVVYRFKVTHQANTAWNASEVDATNLGAELTSFHGDMKALDGKKANADSMFLYKSAFPGSVVEVEDAVAECVKQMQIEIAPVQDLHGYGKPWVGGAGKNKVDPSLTTKRQLKSDGSFGSNEQYRTIYIASLSAGTYTISSNLNYMVRYKYTVSGSETVVGVSITANSYTFTLDTDVTDFYFCLRTNPQGEITVADIQLESGSTATEFEPYSNICPISGHTGCEIVRTGKNLFDKSVYVHVGVIRGDDGAESSTNTSNYTDPIGGILPNTKYTISGTRVGTNQSSRIYFLDQYKNWISRSDGIPGNTPYTFTTPNNCYYIELQYIKAYGDLNTVQIEKGESASTYEPFGNTYSITFPSEAGTVYGGTLTLNQDGTGTLVVDHAMKTLSGSFNAADNGTFYIDGQMMDGEDAKFICNMYEYGGTINATLNAKTNYPGKICSQMVPAAQAKLRAAVYDPTFSSIEAFNTFLASNPMQIVYELVTPTTYQLNIDQVRLLLGYNTLYASTGSILSMLYPTSQVEAVANAKADGILETSSTPAAVMSFSDGADGMPMGMEVAIEPVQDLHGYDKPWIGGAGKNLIGIQKSRMNASGVIEIASTAMRSDYISVSAGDVFIASKKNLFTDGNSNMMARCLDSNKVIQSSEMVLEYYSTEKTFTVPSGIAYVVFVQFCDAVTSVEYQNTNEIMIRRNGAASGYEPYSNICPISGFDHAEVTRTGKNLLDINKSVADKYINASGEIISNTGTSYSELIPVKTGNYTLGMRLTVSTNTNTRIHGYDKFGNWIQQIVNVNTQASGVTTHTFAITSDIKAIRISYRTNTEDIQIEEGATATAYEPFGQTYSITFPTSAGTVYGGTLKVNNDGTGTLVVDHADTDLGSLDYTMDTVAGRFMTGITGIKQITQSVVGYDADLISSAFFYSALGKDNMPNGSMRYNASNSPNIVLKNNAYNDATNFKTSVSGQHIVYPLAAVSTYTLSAPQVKTILGLNNIWADTGEINSVEYSADTKSYIDNLFSSITSAEGQTF